MRHVVIVLGGVKYPETSIEGRKDICVLLLDTSHSDQKRDLHNNLTIEQRLVCNVEKILQQLQMSWQGLKLHRRRFSP